LKWDVQTIAPGQIGVVSSIHIGHIANDCYCDFSRGFVGGTKKLIHYFESGFKTVMMLESRVHV
jgi:hypothetical protein